MFKGLVTYITAALLVLFAVSAQAHDIVAVQSVRVKPYEDAVRGFRSVNNASMTRIVLSELQGRDLYKLIRDERPKVILAIGSDALALVKRIKDIPIVYMMVLNPASIIQGHSNITGVSMNISAERQLHIFQKVLPSRIKRIGLIYDPTKTTAYVRHAAKIARAYGFEIVAREARSPKEVAPLINSLHGRIDAYWMVPDQTLMTPDTVEHLLLFSVDTMVPVLSFATKYVEMGALMSVNFDVVDLGRQAAELARKVQNGVWPGDLPPIDARRSYLKYNSKVAHKLEIGYDEDTVNRFSPEGSE